MTGCRQTNGVDEGNDEEVMIIQEVLGDIVRRIAIDQLVGEAFNHLILSKYGILRAIL